MGLIDRLRKRGLAAKNRANGIEPEADPPLMPDPRHDPAFEEAVTREAEEREASGEAPRGLRRARRPAFAPPPGHFRGFHAPPPPRPPARFR